MKKQILFTLFYLLLIMGNAEQNITPKTEKLKLSDQNGTIDKNDIQKNPLIAEWKTPFQTPPFDIIKLEHYLPAFEYAMKVAKDEIYMIANQKSTPTFENTIVALDRSGSLLNRVSGVFFNMLSANTNPEIQKLAQQISPILTTHSNELYHNIPLFKRVMEVYKTKDKLKNEEDQVLLEKTYKAFVNSGAQLSEQDKETYNSLSLELSKLTLLFGENVLAATNEFEVVFSSVEELKGIPANALAIAQAKAKEKGHDGYLFDLSAPSYGVIMKYADDRKLREKFFMQYNTRATNGEYDNKNTIHEIVSLRYKMANLLGYETYADYVLQDRMAENPKNVYNLLDELLKVSLPMAQKEMEELTKFANSIGHEGVLERWDFTYYSEIYKNKKFDLTDEMLKPYFKLENVIDGVFKLTKKLYNLTYKLNSKIPVYHSDVKA